MKVLHINEHLAHKGGVETYLLALLPMLRERGLETHAVYEEGDAALHEPSTRVPGVGQASFSSHAAVRRRVNEVLEQERPDLVHLHNVQNLGVWQACLDTVPTVMTAHDFRAICPANMFFFKRTQEVCERNGAGPGCFAATLMKHCLTPRPRYAAYYYHRSRWMMDHADRLAQVVAPSSGARQRLLQAGFDEQQVTVLPYFCPLPPLSQPRPRPERPTITFIGRIAPNKGQEYFVEALGLLPEQVQGIMVGSFDEGKEQYVRNLAQKQGCQDRIELHGWASRAEVLQILDMTSVFIFPSLWPETLGIVGLEALSRGVPVVASDIGGVREWLRHGENGYLVPPKDPHQIRDAVMKLISSERDLEKFGQCGIETIRQRFLPEHHTDELVQLYARAAERSNTRTYLSQSVGATD